MNSATAKRGAVVLCGGTSERMGRDKARLPFGNGQTLLGAVVARISNVIGGGPLVCVAAEGQELPALPGTARVVRDRSPERGPLEALTVGLQATRAAGADVVLAVGCDAPLLAPRLAELLFDRLATYDAVVPVVAGRRQPLLAVYRPGVAEPAERLLAAGKASLMALLDAIQINEVPEDGLRTIDPGLQSLMNCNTPETYKETLRIAFPPRSQPPTADSQQPPLP